MLDEKTKNFLLILLAVIFIFSSVSGVLFAGKKQNIITTKRKNVHINDFVNYLNIERERYYNMLLENKQKVDFELLKSEEFTMNILQKKLYEVLIENEIEKYNVQEPTVVLLAKIVNDESFHDDNGKFDNLKFKQFLEKTRLSEEAVLDIVKKDDEKKFVSILSNQVNAVPNFFIKKLMNSYNTQKEIYVFKKNINSIKKQNVNVTDEEIKQYYEANKQNFVIQKQMKVDYVEFDKLTQTKIEEIDDIVMSSENINDLAKTLKTQVKTIGYKTVNELSSINFLKNFDSSDEDLNEISRVVENEGKFYVYSVVDVKNKYTKSLDEAKKDIIAVFEKNKRKDVLLESTNKILQKYEDKNFNMNTEENIFKENGFSVEKIMFNRRTNNIKMEMLFEILNLGEKRVSRVFLNDDEISFVVVNKISIMNKNNPNYISEEMLKNNYYMSLNSSVRQKYFDFLKNVYDAKTQLKLLKSIQQ